MPDDVTPNPTAPEPTPATDPAAPPPEPAKPDTPPADPGTPEPAKPEEEKFSSRFAALSRKDREIRQKQAELKEAMTKVEAFTKDIEQLKADPLAFMEKHGITYQDMTNRVLGGAGKADPVAVLTKELSDLKAEIAAERKAVAEAQYQSAETGYKQTIFQHIQNTPDLEFCRANPEIVDTIYSEMKEFYDTTGKTIDLKVACEEAEKFLESRVKQYLQSEKAKKLWAPKPESPTPESKATKTEGSPKTLTNSQAAKVVTPEAKRRLTREQSLEEAAKQIRFT